jgi:hypothetical protein
MHGILVVLLPPLWSDSMIVADDSGRTFVNVLVQGEARFQQQKKISIKRGNILLLSEFVYKVRFCQLPWTTIEFCGGKNSTAVETDVT